MKEKIWATFTKIATLAGLYGFVELVRDKSKQQELKRIIENIKAR